MRIDQFQIILVNRGLIDLSTVANRTKIKRLTARVVNMFYKGKIFPQVCVLAKKRKALTDSHH